MQDVKNSAYSSSPGHWQNQEEEKIPDYWIENFHFEFFRRKVNSKDDQPVTSETINKISFVSSLTQKPTLTLTNSTRQRLSINSQHDEHTQDCSKEITKHQDYKTDIKRTFTLNHDLLDPCEMYVLSSISELSFRPRWLRRSDTIKLDHRAKQPISYEDIAKRLQADQSTQKNISGTINQPSSQKRHVFHFSMKIVALTNDDLMVTGALATVNS